MAEYIERERTVELLRSLGNREYRKEKGTIQDAIKMISYPEYTPAADVAPVRHGRWEVSTDEWFETDVYTCSKCRESYVLVEGTPKENLWHYCPNCGAQMHEDDFCSYGERKEDKSE